MSQQPPALHTVAPDVASPSRPAQEFDKLSDFFRAHYRLELVERDLCVKGWNWGTVRFGGESRGRRDRSQRWHPWGQRWVSGGEQESPWAPEPGRFFC